MTIDASRFAGRVLPVTISLINVINAAAKPSPTWTLDRSDANTFSRASLSDFMSAAYLDPRLSARNDSTGKMFETIGRMVHHLQDMAQPQHVRNDVHLGMDFLEKYCVNWIAECRDYRALSTPSGYETWTRRFALEELPVNGYAPVYSAADTSTFSNPRRFWKHDGKGLAEFTSRNFVSAGTLDRQPPARGAPVEDVLASTLCAGARPSCGAADLSAYVRFYSSYVDDQLRPTASRTNARAAAESIYSYDFQRIVSPTPVLSLNRFNFKEAYEYLIPRAVGYSAGFINYLFRGEMKVRPPAEGVYALVDTSSGCGVPCGFRRVKLRLQNTTPGDEVMGPGELRAVLKFHRNGCYRTDLSGQYGGTNFAGNSCRLGEGIAVSAPKPVSTQVARGEGGETLAFDFSADAIPLDISDARLQIVYRGRLGQEADAVVVTTLDIAEPNYFAIGNISDYAFDTTTNRYRPSNLSEAITLRSAQMSFVDPVIELPIATIPELAPGEHAQIAFLAGKSSVRWWLRSAGPWENLDDYSLDPEEFVLDESVEPPRYRGSCALWKWRGAYRQFAWYFAANARSVHPLGDVAGKKANIAKLNGDEHCQAEPVAGIGGPNDLSLMTPLFTAANQRQWTIRFDDVPAP